MGEFFREVGSGVASDQISESLNDSDDDDKPNPPSPTSKGPLKSNNCRPGSGPIDHLVPVSCRRVCKCSKYFDGCEDKQGMGTGVITLYCLQNTDGFYRYTSLGEKVPRSPTGCNAENCDPTGTVFKSTVPCKNFGFLYFPDFWPQNFK